MLRGFLQFTTRENMDQQSLKNEQYRLERLGKEALKRGDMHSYQRYGNEAFQKVYSKLKMPQSEALSYVFRTSISKEIIAVVFGSGTHMFPALTKEKIPACVAYVENLLETDLNPVEIVFTTGDFNHAEGRAQPCADTEHYVILPSPEHDFTSEDLLVHELGHAAEYMRRRPTEEYGFYSPHKLFTEAIAHFIQFHYLTDHGTKEQRLAVFGSVLRDYMIMKALEATYELTENTAPLDARQAITHEVMADLVSVYGKARTLEILLPFNGQPFWALYYNLVEPRMGFVLALKLFNNKEAILKLTTEKQERPLKETLDSLGLNGEELMDFSEADSLIKKFIDKTL
jgi:hypothetical protein